MPRGITAFCAFALQTVVIMHVAMGLQDPPLPRLLSTKPVPLVKSGAVWRPAAKVTPWILQQNCSRPRALSFPRQAAQPGEEDLTVCAAKPQNELPPVCQERLVSSASCKSPENSLSTFRQERKEVGNRTRLSGLLQINFLNSSDSALPGGESQDQGTPSTNFAPA